MASGSLRFIDEETGGIVLLDSSDWQKPERKYSNHTGAIEGLTFVQLRELIEAIMGARLRAQDYGDFRRAGELKLILAEIKLNPGTNTTT